MVGRSGAPQLRLRITAALTLTLLGKALGVAAPVLLGIAVNELAAGYVEARAALRTANGRISAIDCILTAAEQGTECEAP